MLEQGRGGGGGGVTRERAAHMPLGTRSSRVVCQTLAAALLSAALRYTTNCVGAPAETPDAMEE